MGVIVGKDVVTVAAGLPCLSCIASPLLEFAFPRVDGDADGKELTLSVGVCVSVSSSPLLE